MNPKKMLVVYLTGTKAVLGVASRRAAGAPAVDELVGAALPLRASGMDAGVAVAAADLAVKEVDFAGDVFRQPLNHGLDDNDGVVLATSTLSASYASSKVTITLTPATVADKAALVVIDVGANREPLKFSAKTTTSGTLVVPVTGVPSGSHDVLISVDGYPSLLAAGGF